MAGIIESLRRTLFDFQKDVDDLGERLDAAEQNERALVKQLTGLQGEIERLQAREKELEKEIETLKQQIDG